MPPQYPKRDTRFLAWARMVTRVWTGTQPGGSGQVPDIGLSEERALRAAELFTIAHQRHLEHVLAQVRARSATNAKNRAFEALKEALGSDLTTIAGYAKATKDQGVYARAAIRPRKRQGRIAPVAPSNMRLSFLSTEGAVDVRWDGKTLPGTAYLLERSLRTDAGQGPMEMVGTTTNRRFIDRTLPPGVRSVTYQVRAIKGRQQAFGATSVMDFHARQTAVSARASDSAQPAAKDGGRTRVA